VRRAKLGAERGHDRDGEQDAREGQQHLHGAHHRRVEAREVAREQAEQDPGDRADRGGEDPDHQREPGAVEDAAQDAAAELVGAEREFA
jgi:hypothetical protein